MRSVMAAVAAVVCVVLAPGLAAAQDEAARMATLLGRIGDLRAAITDGLQAQLMLSFNDEARLAWNFFPGDRKGLVLSALDEVQQQQVFAVLESALSAVGYEKAEAIRQMENVLRDMEKGNPGRDPMHYYLAVFGEPAAIGAWGLRWEGHHLSLNWTFVDGKVVASSPQFMGSNPGDGGKNAAQGPLAAEESLGRALAVSLRDEARAQGISSEDAPGDIITRMQQEVSPLEDHGVAYAALAPMQQGLLIALIELYASVQPAAIAQERIAKIRADGLDAVKFLWIGGLKPGQGHYYRIQGKSFLIEYDNTQNDANHIHTVWRDFDGDFGRDVLREHLEHDHHQ